MIVMFASSCHPVSVFERYAKWRSHAASIGYRAPTGRDHCPAELAVSDGMEQDAGGAAAVAPAAAALEDDDGGGGDDPDPARRRPKHKTPSRAPSRAAAATAGFSTPPNPDPTLWRLPEVLARVPVSRGTWQAGVKAGKFPQPVRLSARVVAWRASDIEALVRSL